MAEKTPKSVIEECIRLNHEGMHITEAGAKFGISRQIIWRWAKIYGLTIKKNWNATFDSSVFDQIDTDEKAYWLGFIYGDGYIGYDSSKKHRPLAKFELSLKLSDKNHLEKFKQFLNWSGTVYTDSFRCRIQIHSEELCQKLLTLGVHNKKSLTLTFPNLNQVPIPLRMDFIRGYFDADGCLGSPKWPIVIDFLGTYEFLVATRNWLRVTPLLYKQERYKGNTYNFRMHGKNALYVLESMYGKASIYLDRKYDRYKAHKIAYSTRNNGVKGGKIGEVHHGADNTERATGESCKPVVFVEHSS